MTKGGKLGIVGGAGILLVVGAIFWARRGDGDERGHRREGSAADRSGRWRGFAAGTPGVQDPAGAVPAAPSDEPEGKTDTPEAAARLQTMMDTWRHAVAVRDADTVLMLDAAFTSTPARYTDALSRSASSDDNERVRAFSTRVLGKFKTPELVPLFARLLEDKSPYVRQNAAWALGELGGQPDGREAAQSATAALRRLQQQDAAEDVRVAANSALKRLEP